MLEALKVLLLFKKMEGDDCRWPYILCGIIGWLEIIAIIISIIK